MTSQIGLSYLWHHSRPFWFMISLIRFCCLWYRSRWREVMMSQITFASTPKQAVSVMTSQLVGYSVADCLRCLWHCGRLLCSHDTTEWGFFVLFFLFKFWAHRIEYNTHLQLNCDHLASLHHRIPFVTCDIIVDHPASRHLRLDFVQRHHRLPTVASE